MANLDRFTPVPRRTLDILEIVVVELVVRVLVVALANPHAHSDGQVALHVAVVDAVVAGVVRERDNLPIRAFGIAAVDKRAITQLAVRRPAERDDVLTARPIEKETLDDQVLAGNIDMHVTGKSHLAGVLRAEGDRFVGRAIASRGESKVLVSTVLQRNDVAGQGVRDSLRRRLGRFYDNPSLRPRRRAEYDFTHRKQERAAGNGSSNHEEISSCYLAHWPPPIV